MNRPDAAKKMMEEVHSDLARFQASIQNYLTITNLGQTLSMFQRYSEIGESDDEAEAIDAEYKSWAKDAKKITGWIVKHSLPWTLTTVDAVWEDKKFHAAK